MNVELERAFPVPGAADVAWGFLQDIEAVAACMPGAKITEKVADDRFKGTVTVKVGPATMSFRGEVTVRDIDPATHSLKLLGKGTDSTGTSGASMDLAARIDAAGPGSSNLVGKSDVSMSGKAAAFGGRMMTSVADQVLKQFADGFVQAARAAQGRQSAAGDPPPKLPQLRQRRPRKRRPRNSTASHSYGPRSRIGCAGFSASARRESHFTEDERRDRPAAAVAGSGLHRRAHARRSAPVDARSRPPAAPRRGCGRRQDGSREGTGERARRPAHSAAML
jgi:carbon monoxide dehydrogenase subunit G